MKIGLFFGSFNPIHVGHLIIANHMVQQPELDQVWFIVSPQSPFKNKSSLLPENHRLTLVKLAIENLSNLKADDIEFKLPQPSYTIDTLAYLKEKHPQHAFSLIMGEDNLTHFEKWKNYDKILQNHSIYVYPRLGEKTTESPLKTHKSIYFCEDVPLMKISASFIRQQIADKKDVRFLVTEPVRKYIEEMHFYSR
ncbi:MAG: nicotinate-nucleotide adenylyltransferase [Lentimonas sp.]|jgi:nicotinate-nucleotide adenylyltransferase